MAREGGGVTYATTFSGIGGWELGLNACGWELKWQCEREPFCRVLLNERFGVPIYPDIRTICDQNPPPVDALIGSPPCQPFSIAGAQGGTADERHLYPAFIKLVAAIQPRWVLMEQVPNVLAIDGGRAFAGYVGGLAALNYDVVAHCIPACAVGAPHQRDRLWIVAHSKHRGLQVGRGIGHVVESGREPLGISGHERQSLQLEAQTILANSNRDGFNGNERQSPAVRQGNRKKNGIPGKNGSVVSNARRAGFQELDAPGFAAKPGHHSWPFAPGGQNWAVEPNVGRVANGIPFRVDRLKGLGNAVLPQIPFLIGQAINQIEAEINL